MKNLPYFIYSLSTILAENNFVRPDELSLGMTGFGGSNMAFAYNMIPIQNLSEHNPIEWLSWPEPPQSTPLPAPTQNPAPLEDFPQAFQYAITQLSGIHQSYSKHIVMVTDGIVSQLSDFEEIVENFDEDILNQNNIHIHIVATCPQQQSIYDAWANRDIRHNDFVQVFLGGEQYPTSWSPKNTFHLVQALVEQMFGSRLPDQNAGWLVENADVDIPRTSREIQVAVVSLAQSGNVDFSHTPRPFVLFPNDITLEIKNLNNLWEYSLVGDNGVQPLAKCESRTWLLRSNLNTPAFYFYDYKTPSFSQIASSFQLLDDEGNKLDDRYTLAGSTPPELQVSTTISVDGFSDVDYLAFNDCYSITLSVIDESGHLLLRNQISNLVQDYLWSVALDNLTKGQEITFIQEVSTAEENVVFSIEESIFIEFLPTLEGEVIYRCPTDTCFDNGDSSQDSFQIDIQTDWRGEITQPVVRFVSDGVSSDCSGELTFNGNGNSHFTFNHEFDQSNFESSYKLLVSRHVPVAPNIFSLFMNQCGYFLIEWPDLSLPEFKCEFTEHEPRPTEDSLSLICTALLD